MASIPIYVPYILLSTLLICLTSLSLMCFIRKKRQYRIRDAFLIRHGNFVQLVDKTSCHFRRAYRTGHVICIYKDVHLDEVLKDCRRLGFKLSCMNGEAVPQAGHYITVNAQTDSHLHEHSASAISEVQVKNNHETNNKESKVSVFYIENESKDDEITNVKKIQNDPEIESGVYSKEMSSDSLATNGNSENSMDKLKTLCDLCLNDQQWRKTIAGTMRKEDSRDSGRGRKPSGRGRYSNKRGRNWRQSSDYDHAMERVTLCAICRHARLVQGLTSRNYSHPGVIRSLVEEDDTDIDIITL